MTFRKLIEPLLALLVDAPLWTRRRGGPSTEGSGRRKAAKEKAAQAEGSRGTLSCRSGMTYASDSGLGKTSSTPAAWHVDCSLPTCRHVVGTSQENVMTQQNREQADQQRQGGNREQEGGQRQSGGNREQEGNTQRQDGGNRSNK